MVEEEARSSAYVVQEALAEVAAGVVPVGLAEGPGEEAEVVEYADEAYLALEEVQEGLEEEVGVVVAVGVPPQPLEEELGQVLRPRELDVAVQEVLLLLVRWSPQVAEPLLLLQ